jgi:hypothetical protein
MAQLPSTIALVRLHASETLDDYQKMQRANPSVRSLGNFLCTLGEALAAVDVVLVESSGFGNDAVLKGECSVVPRTDDPDHPSGRELVREAGCLAASSVAQLGETIDEILRSAGLRAQVSAKADAYASRFCAVYAENAAQRIADAVLIRASSRAAPTTCRAFGSWI